MMKSRLFLLCIIMQLVSLTTVRAVTVGSDTAVTRLYSQVTLNNGDIVTGFTELQGGFVLTDASVTATWNALFPVSGNITLNSGSLYLQRDLFINGIATVSLSGAIIGNGFMLDLASNVKLIPGAGNGACVPSLLISPSVGTTSHLASVGWSFDDQFVAIVGNSGEFNYRFNGVSLTLVDNSITAALQCLAWHPSAYYIAIGAQSGTNGLALYSVNSSTGVLTQTSTKSIAPIGIAWHPTGFYVASVTGSSAPNIFLYGVNAAGQFGTTTSVNSSLTLCLSCDWIATGTYLAVGQTNGIAGAVYVYALGGTPASPTLTSLFNFSVSSLPQIVRWNPVYTNTLAVGFNSSSGTRVQIWQCNFTTNTATNIISLTSPPNAVSLLDWSNDGSCLKVGGSPLNGGSPGFLYSYSFNLTTSTLTLVSTSTFNDDNGSSYISTTGRYSPVNNYVAQAANPASGPQLRISTPGPSAVALSNLTMVMHSDLSLQNYIVTFSGNCMIQGNNNSLSVASPAGIAVAANSTLTLKNLTLTPIIAGSIQMLASTSNLVLDNTNLILDGTFSFTQGSLVINKDVTISGFNSNVLFSSSLPCIVRSKSQLFLDELVTWSHVPPTNANNLLQFTDRSSYLYLNGASLVTTRTGLNLTKGTLVVDRHSYIASSAQVAAEAVTLGDGVNAANDMIVQIYPAATLDVSQGILVNNNV